MPKPTDIREDLDFAVNNGYAGSVVSVKPEDVLNEITESTGMYGEPELRDAYLAVIRLWQHDYEEKADR